MNAFKSFLHGKSIERSDDAAIVPNGDLEQDFIYDKLDPKVDQIRLLQLQRRSSGSSLIECDVQTFNITQAPPFQALSYEWGPADSLRQIRVNDARLAIRENLWAFLDMYRTRTRDRGYIWIDQICIDQANLEERSLQVQLMSQVFSMATTVLVWLGNTSNPRLSYVGCQMQASSRHCKLPLRYSSLNALVSLTYWRRLWIIQELALARHTTFYLGRQKIDGSHLREYLASSSDHKAYEMITCMDGIYYISWLLSLNKSREQSIWDIILDVYYRTDINICCSDPRDLIFGLLGIAPRVSRLRVDYTLPTEEVFGDLLNSLIHESGDMLTMSLKWRLEHLAQSMARLAMRLGVPPRWSEALQIDSRRREDPRGSAPEDAASVNLKYGLISLLLPGFLRALMYLQMVGLDEASLSGDNILVIMTHARHVLGIQNWAESPKVLSYKPAYPFIVCKYPNHQRALTFFVKITPRARALCTEREVPFFLPHIPWPFHDDLSDEQLEEFMWPEAGGSSEGVPGLPPSDCWFCSRLVEDEPEVEERDQEGYSLLDDDIQHEISSVGAVVL